MNDSLIVVVVTVALGLAGAILASRYFPEPVPSPKVIHIHFAGDKS